MEILRSWLNGSRDYATGVKIYSDLGTDHQLKRMFAEPESEFKRKKLISVLESIWESRNKAILPAKPVLPTNTSVTTGAFKIKRELVKSRQEISSLREHVEFKDELIKDQASDLEDLEWEKEQLEEEKEELQEENQVLKKKIKKGWPIEMDDTVKALHSQWRPKFLAMVDLMSRIYEVGKAGKTDPEKRKDAGVMALQILDLRDEVIRIYEKRDHYISTGNLPEDPPPVEDCLDPKLWPVKLQNAQRYVRQYKNELKKLDPASDPFLRKLKQLQKWEAEVDKYKKLLNLD